jgi:hypothetical protein
MWMLDAAQSPLWHTKKPPRHHHQQRQQRRLAKIPSTATAAALLLGAFTVLFLVGSQWRCMNHRVWSLPCCWRLDYDHAVDDHTLWWDTTTVSLALPTRLASVPLSDDSNTSTSPEDDWFQTTIARGSLHFITPISGCALAAWVYESKAIPRKFRDCRHLLPAHAATNSTDFVAHRELRPHNAHLWAPFIQPNDTVYVTIKGLADFYQEILPLLPVPIVLISGQWHKGINDTLEVPLVQGLLDHHLITKWFCHNVDVYMPTSAIYASSSLQRQLPVKLAPWPFGLQHAPYNPHDPTAHVDPLAAYRAAFVRHWYNDRRKKTHHVFVGYTNPHTNPLRQHSVPHRRTAHRTPPRLNLTDYYDALTRHRYVQSPNGDRPECYRHYEAIGLGTVPLTQLHPLYYAHLAPAPVVYNVTNYGHWTTTTTSTQASLRTQSFRHSIVHATPATNRRMVTEEYWMDYVERLVAMPVRWADRTQHYQPRFQRDFGNRHVLFEVE